jgi:hypothetical protein
VDLTAAQRNLGRLLRQAKTSKTLSVTEADAVIALIG